MPRIQGWCSSTASLARCAPSMSRRGAATPPYRANSEVMQSDLERSRPFLSVSICPGNGVATTSRYELEPSTQLFERARAASAPFVPLRGPARSVGGYPALPLGTVSAPIPTEMAIRRWAEGRLRGTEMCQVSCGSPAPALTGVSVWRVQLTALKERAGLTRRHERE